MSMRLTDTGKWLTDRWFRKLDDREKLLFLWLCDNCDCAGFLEWDPEVVEYQLKWGENELEGAFLGLQRPFSGACKVLARTSKAVSYTHLTLPTN